MEFESIECRCCLDIVPILQTICCTDDGSHMVCDKCVESNIQEHLFKYNLNIECMSVDFCNGFIKENDLLTCLSDQLKERYFKIQQQIYLSSIYPNCIVTCPFCNFDMICETVCMDGNIICLNEECAKTSCVLCKNLPHWPILCTNENKHRKEQEESDTYKVIRVCPNCKVDIEKDGGCNHVDCSRCKHTMCYTCGIDISNNSFEHTCYVFNQAANVTRSYIQTWYLYGTVTPQQDYFNR